MGDVLNIFFQGQRSSNHSAAVNKQMKKKKKENIFYKDPFFLLIGSL